MIKTRMPLTKQPEREYSSMHADRSGCIMISIKEGQPPLRPAGGGCVT